MVENITCTLGSEQHEHHKSLWTKISNKSSCTCMYHVWDIIKYACHFLHPPYIIYVKETKQVDGFYQGEDWSWEGFLKSLNDNFTLLNWIKLLWCHPSCLHQALIATHAVPQSCIYTIISYDLFFFIIDKFISMNIWKKMNLLLIEDSGIDSLWLIDQTSYRYRH